MKNRHKQKLVILSITLFVMLNAPVLLLFNGTKSFMGLPAIYAYLFAVWFASSLLSFLIFRKYNE
ncbi:hypothetical protein H1R16_03435 [Marnyiella aurantia]|uniref:DUF3311 domain-containing protein n=1 Tax=Marnyiella aurantia TaxID=2758037 RepID=A0A7D7QWT4_9FLAO|nr:hypothetical protein [Marnyiella aurantia]MBA5247309.1 hypothetical protein [Marnyiella aurantia]QMS99070.1 hypothetical protein H1R16_03435 [Marnyiella aurantia]